MFISRHWHAAAAAAAAAAGYSNDALSTHTSIVHMVKEMKITGRQPLKEKKLIEM